MMEFATFNLKFEKDVELTGYLKLRLWVEAEGSNDMDLFVTVQKLDTEGKLYPVCNHGRASPRISGQIAGLSP